MPYPMPQITSQSVAWQCLFIHIFMGGVMLEVVRTEFGAMKKKGVR
jgi:hypothetical protein